MRWVTALNDPFVRAGYQLCGEYPPLPDPRESFRDDPQDAARKQLAHFIYTLGTVKRG